MTTATGATRAVSVQVPEELYQAVKAARVNIRQAVIAGLERAVKETARTP